MAESANQYLQRSCAGVKALAVAAVVRVFDGESETWVRKRRSLVHVTRSRLDGCHASNSRPAHLLNENDSPFGVHCLFPAKW